MRLPRHRYSGQVPWEELDLDGLPEDELVRVQAAYLASQLSARLDQEDAPSILELEQILEGARSE